MNVSKTPHILPYQGSKRKIANKILNYICFNIDGSFIEPFAGSAAVSLAAIKNNIATSYTISDKYSPISNLFNLIKDNPTHFYELYNEIWLDQFKDSKAHYNDIRKKFNSDLCPVKFFYLMTRCVKNAIRFNSLGEFNQSSDKRRHGANPQKIKNSIFEISNLLKNNVKILNEDYEIILNNATSKDVVYLDPPWQGTSTNKNQRYAYMLDYEKFTSALKTLNDKNIPFLLSFDGRCGDKSYGEGLPNYLSLTKIEINVGRSSQATLLGKVENTIESLYLSTALIQRNFKYQKCA